MEMVTEREVDDLVLQSVVNVCQTSLVGCQSEFVMQHVIMDALLPIPGIAIETGTQGFNGQSRKEIKIVNGRSMMFGVQRKLPKGFSLDFMMVKPFEYTLELKTRSDFGSGDACGAEAIFEDLKRVIMGQVTGFVLAADVTIYKGLSTNLQPNRQRTYETFNYFPPIVTVGSGEHKFNGLVNRWIAIEAPTKTIRIVSLIKREKA